jgi:hypothetical protein
MVRYFIFIDNGNTPHPNRPMREFESFEKAWELCPQNYLLAIGSQEELQRYYEQPLRVKKVVTENA